MRTVVIDTLSEAVKLERTWHTLAEGHPFRTPDWLLTWWSHFAPSGSSLALVVVYDESETVIGIAPLYRDANHTLRLLGDGSVCTDHSTILIERQQSAAEVTACMADQLARDSQDQSRLWSGILLENVPHRDTALRSLAIALESRNCRVHLQPSLQLWELHLEGGWEKYVSRLSKNARKQLRRTERLWDRADYQWIESQSQVDAFMDHLIELHQRRWVEKGMPGCFADRRFEGFLRDVATKAIDRRIAKFQTASHNGQVIAADFALASETAIFCFQAGLDSQFLNLEPGKLMNLRLIQDACQRGMSCVDFLRGDEPYKEHLRAEPISLVNYRIAAPAWPAQIRHHVWLASTSAKHYAKKFIANTTRVSMPRIFRGLKC